MPRQAIFFLIDTQGTKCVGCYSGNSALKTPNIDRLAADGVRFDHAYTCSPVCGPARSAIMTGLYPHATGVLGNDQAPHADLPTIGQRLQQEGFVTGYVGKWHLDGSDYFGDGRCAEGWHPDYWFDGRNYLDSLPDDHARSISRLVHGPEEVKTNGITEEFTHAHRIADRARAFIEAHRDEDFFLVVSIDEPHHPFICPEPFVSGFDDFEFSLGATGDDDLASKPQSQREWAAHFQEGHVNLERREDGLVYKNPNYFACNSYSDYEVGRVISAIDEHIPSSMVVYSSDHGDMFHRHRLNGKGPCSYEEICNIPFIVRWPGQTQAGSQSASPVSHIDLVPTFLDYFGVEPPPLLQGKSLLAQCQDPAHATNDKVFIEFNRFELDHDGFGGFTPIRTVFDGRYKLAINLLDSDEFYDLQEDPEEMTNLIDNEATTEIRDRLHDAILAWQGETRDILRTAVWGRRSWRDIGKSTWGGPTRPRPFDDKYFPRSLLYDTGEEIDRFVYEKC